MFYLHVLGSDLWITVGDANSAALLHLTEASPTPEVLVMNHIEPSGEGPELSYGTKLVTQKFDSSALGRVSLEDGESAIVAHSGSTSPVLFLRDVDEAHVYYWASEVEPEGIYRAPLDTPASAELLRESGTAYGSVLAHDGYLYWVERDRLLRQALPQ